MRRCWSSRRCLFRLSTGQVLERGRGLISDVECVCARCRTRIGESAYFRVYIPPIQEFITLDSTLTEIYRIRNRLEGRREYQAFRFGGSSSSRTTWISRSTRSQHHRPVCRPATPLLSLSLSICLSLSFLSDNERQNESFLSSWPSLDRRKNWQGEGFLGRDAPYLFSLRRIKK